MAAKYIGLGDFTPGAVRIAAVTLGMASNDVDVSLGNTTVTSDLSTGDKALFKVWPGVFVSNVHVVVGTAFNSTGSPTITIGDTDVDGFMPSCDIVASDAGVKSMIGGSTGGAHSGAYVGGRVYSTADTLDTDGYATINAQVATAPWNAGKATIYLEYFQTKSVTK